MRLLILVGRTQPGPQAAEALAAALSGRQSQLIASGPKGFAWYPQVQRGIRLLDGRGNTVASDQHPDPFVENVRQLICEAELIQALGRARAVNRTAKSPLDIDLLFDTCLPITVNEVLTWKVPSLLIETAAEGVMLTSPGDLVKLWNMFWPNRRAASRTLKLGIPQLPGFIPITYQLAGAKMNRRQAWFDPAIIADAQGWLMARLGPMVP